MKLGRDHPRLAEARWVVPSWMFATEGTRVACESEGTCDQGVVSTELLGRALRNKLLKGELVMHLLGWFPTFQCFQHKNVRSRIPQKSVTGISAGPITIFLCSFGSRELIQQHVRRVCDSAGGRTVQYFLKVVLSLTNRQVGQVLAIVRAVNGRNVMSRISE